MKPLIITTGGTIGALRYPDPRKHPAYSSFPPARTCYVRRALMGSAIGLTAQDCQWHALPPRDSKHINAAYRTRMIRSIRHRGAQRVLITHGTDALLATAAHLYRAKPLRRRAIILTGAMLPLANGAASDGQQNLLHALRYLRQRHLQAGIYIVLSDYIGHDRHWQPRLYRFVPGTLTKYYDPERPDRSRLLVKNSRT